MTDKLLVLALASLFWLAAGCGSPLASPSPTTLTVFAAASLTEAFTEMAAEFEADRPNVAVTLHFAGSQTLRIQLENGAQADLFASANPHHMQVLVDADLVQQPLFFTQNRLVVILPVDNPASVESLADLAQPGLKLIVAGPTVPVGRYAREMLHKLEQGAELGPDFAGRVLANVVSEEDNVKSVLAKVRLGEADAGIVYASDVTPELAGVVKMIEVPPPSNVVARYPIAMTRQSIHPELARQFIEFLLSTRGQMLLATHGFRQPQLQASGTGP